MNNAPIREILRQNEVIRITGLSQPTLYRKEKRGEFPRKVRLGANSVGWFKDEVVGWLESRQEPSAATAA